MAWVLLDAAFVLSRMGRAAAERGVRGSLRQRLPRATRLAVVALLTVNAGAVLAARAFTHIVPAAGRTSPAYRQSLLGKAQSFLRETRLIRPRRRGPAPPGLVYEQHTIPVGPGLSLAAWLIPKPDARGLVVLFHGYANNKSQLVPAAHAFYALGYETLLVDFRASGDSGGDATSIGFHESEDVRRAFEHAQWRAGDRPVLLFGVSMGAAAVLKAVGRDGLRPAALIVEAPFDRLLSTVGHRFRARGVPAFPGAHLLVFWGGAQLGFNGFAHNPVDYAAGVPSPALLLSGGADPYVRAEEARAIYDALAGVKEMHVFEGVGHRGLAGARTTEWRRVVESFLGRVLATRVSHS